MNYSKIIKKRNKKISSFINGLETPSSKDRIGCLSCNECHCCKSNKSVPVIGKEVDVIKVKITPKQKERALTSINQKALLGNYTCPFLSEEGRCEIYDIRPLACAGYYTINNTPDDCKNPKGDIVFINQMSLIKHLDQKQMQIIMGEKEDIIDILDMFE